MPAGEDGRTVLTPRLRLRPFRPGDAAACARAEAEVPGIVARFAALWDEVGYGPWAAEDRATGALLGHCGLRLLPELGGETEILYLLDSAAWGRGLATEGAAARDRGLGALGLGRLVAYALPENAASLRVMERIGMRPEGPCRAFGLDAVRYAVP